MQVEDIPRILGWMLSADRHLDHLKSPKPEDGDNKCFCTECLMGRALIKQKALIELRREKLTSRYEELKAQSERLLIATGESKLVYPGIGRLGYYKGLRKVHTTGWDKLPAFQQREVAMLYPELFRVEDGVVPKKKELKELLKAGTNQQLGNLFSLSPETEFVDFRKER